MINEGQEYFHLKTPLSISNWIYYLINTSVMFFLKVTFISELLTMNQFYKIKYEA